MRITSHLESYKIDLHIHTPASRCGKDRDTADLPSRIIRQAIASDLKMIAITDHHAAGYIDRVRKSACQFDNPPVVLPGIELSTEVPGVPDVYFLALFPEQYPVAEIRSLMDELEIPPEGVGDCRFRIKKPIDFILESVYKRGGTAISNHMDKNETRLNFVPELIKRYRIRGFDLKFPESASKIQDLALSEKLSFFTFSDVHRADRIGEKYTLLNLTEPSFEGIRRLISSCREID